MHDFPLVKICIDIRSFDELQQIVLKAIPKLIVAKNEIAYSFTKLFFEVY